jgi:S1-C subfamily serine protease
MIGFKEGDVITKWNGNDLNLQNVNEILGLYANTAKEGDDLKITVLRGDEEIELATTIQAIDVEKENVILPNEKATEAQLNLRKAWLGDYKTK